MILSRFATLLALGTAVYASGGCSFKQPAPIKEAFLVEAKRGAPARSAPGTNVLKVRMLQVAAPFEGRGFVYRRADLQYHADFYNEFLVAPRALLTDQVVQWLSQSGLFALVDNAGRIEPAYALEGTVSELYGDFRNPRSAKAVLAMQFVLTDDQPRSTAALWAHRYREEVVLAQATPAGLAAGWSTALEKILAAFEQDLEKDLAQKPRP